MSPADSLQKMKIAIDRIFSKVTTLYHDIVKIKWVIDRINSINYQD